MPSNEKAQIANLHKRIETTGDVRSFLANIAQSVSRGEIKVQEAAVAVKACEQINASMYAEIKRQAMTMEIGGKVEQLGSLSIRGSE